MLVCIIVEAQFLLWLDSLYCLACTISFSTLLSSCFLSNHFFLFVVLFVLLFLCLSTSKFSASIKIFLFCAYFKPLTDFATLSTHLYQTTFIILVLLLYLTFFQHIAQTIALTVFIIVAT